MPARTMDMSLYVLQRTDSKRSHDISVNYSKCGVAWYVHVFLEFCMNVVPIVVGMEVALFHCSWMRFSKKF